jgi:hypothetical protein
MRHIDRALAGMVRSGAASEHASTALASSGGGLDHGAVGSPGSTRASTAASARRGHGAGSTAGGRSLTLLPLFMTALEEGDEAEGEDGASVAAPRTGRSVGVVTALGGPRALSPRSPGGLVGAAAAGIGGDTAPSPPRRVADPVIHEQRAARRLRRRLAMIDAALAALHASIPGDDAGLSMRTRDTASILSGRSPSRVTVAAPPGEAGEGAAASPGRWPAGTHRSGPASPGPGSVWSLPTAGTAATRVSVTRRLTAADVASEYRRARAQLEAQVIAAGRVPSDSGGSGGGDVAGERAAPDAAQWQHLLAPRSDIARLVEELRRAGAADTLSAIMATSGGGDHDGSDSEDGGGKLAEAGDGAVRTAAVGMGVPLRWRTAAGGAGR